MKLKLDFRDFNSQGEAWGGVLCLPISRPHVK